MADRSTNLSLPFILPSQAQKHVTHNEALLALDAVVQLVLEAEAATPPGAVAEGERFAIATGATGAWSGHDGEIAARQDGAWTFITPKAGWLAWVADPGVLRIFRNNGWTDAQPDQLPTLGVGTGADGVNRLAVASPASLFTHVGQGHQLKINKAAAADTATLLFQSAWTGHAEMGLAGDNAFSIKVSDGSAWRTALRIGSDGRVAMPQRPTARAFKAPGPFAPPHASHSGFTGIDRVEGGVTLGTSVGNGDRRLSVPADGLYLVTLLVAVSSVADHATALVRNMSEVLFTLRAPPTGPLSLSHTQPVRLVAGDELSLLHSGSAEFQEGAGVTELTLVML